MHCHSSRARDARAAQTLGFVPVVGGLAGAAPSQRYCQLVARARDGSAGELADRGDAAVGEGRDQRGADDRAVGVVEHLAHLLGGRDAEADAGRWSLRRRAGGATSVRAAASTSARAPVMPIVETA